MNQEKSSSSKENYDHELLFGVNSEAILSMHHQTKGIVGQNLLVEVLSVERMSTDLKLIMKNRAREIVFRNEEDAILMYDLILGYKEFQRIRKKDKYGN